MKTPRLETDRLILREVQDKDADAIFNGWMQDEDVSRYMCWKASSRREDAEEFVRYELDQIENDLWNRWIIILKSTGQIIGTCLAFYNDGENSWDISYNLAKTYWGQGYTTEAMKKVMEYATHILLIKEIIAVHAVENTASRRVIDKLGFKFVKDVPFECNGGSIHTMGRFYKYTAE